MNVEVLNHACWPMADSLLVPVSHKTLHRSVSIFIRPNLAVLPQKGICNDGHVCARKMTPSPSPRGSGVHLSWMLQITALMPVGLIFTYEPGQTGGHQTQKCISSPGACTQSGADFNSSDGLASLCCSPAKARDRMRNRISSCDLRWAPASNFRSVAELCKWRRRMDHDTNSVQRLVLGFTLLAGPGHLTDASSWERTSHTGAILPEAGHRHPQHHGAAAGLHMTCCQTRGRSSQGT